MRGTCPKREACAFFRSVWRNPILRFKYATMYPYCKGDRHESCIRWWVMDQGLAVPDDLLPDGAIDWFGEESHRTRTPAETRVLVVDEKEPVRRHFADLVKEACGCVADIEEAESAKGALELLASGAEHWTCMVTNRTLVDMSGLDLIAATRARPSYAQLPAIMYVSGDVGGKSGGLITMPRLRRLPNSTDKQPFFDAWRELVVERKA